MKNLKHGLIALAVLVAPMAMAQDQGQPKGKDAQERRERMQEALGLSPDQMQRMKTIHAEHAAKREAIMAIEDPAARKEAMIKAREAHREAMDQVLTPEQSAKAKTIREEHKIRKKEAGAGQGRDIPSRAQARTERMTRELDLRPEQAEKLRALLEQHMTKAQQIRAMEDEAARKAAMHDLKTSQRAATMDLLDPAQQERLKARIAEKRKEGRGKPGRMGHGK